MTTAAALSLAGVVAESRAMRELEATFAYGWFQTITNEVFG